MDEASGRPGTQAPVRSKRKLSTLSRWLLWIGAVALVVLLAVGVTIAILLHRAEPMLRASIIDTLQKRFHSRVELDSFHVSIVDGFQAEGSGLRIWLPAEALANLPDNGSPVQAKPSAARGQKDSRAIPGDQASLDQTWRSQPWIVVDKMHFHASWRILPGKPIVVSVIYVEGVRVLLPPKEERPNLSLSGRGSASPEASDTAQNETAQPQEQPASSTTADSNSGTDSAAKPSLFKMPPIEVRRIECQDALLVIERRQEPGKPAKVPLDFEFKKATVIPDGKGGPMAFSVDMVNAKPIGDIHSTGHAGPWVPRDPGALPLEGDYKFDHADLSTIKGIAGILSSTGHYAGTLRKIEADGQTQTPDFRLERVSSSSGESLTTHFHAIVDGTNGDTWLQPVDAMLGYTHIVAKGKVLRAEDSTGQKHGHDIVLEVAIDRGRIEDILHISATQESPFVTGNLALQTHFHLPPGQESVWDKLQLNGQFHLSEARFSSDKMQGRIEQLSLRGQGKPKEVKTTDPTTVLSEMQGHFKLGGGTLDLPDLDYHVPGADILVRGSYGLKEGTLNFEGDAKLDATISQIVGGWKGFLLKPADRYLRKNGAGTDVPIRVSGTRSAPEFGVEFDRLGKKDKPEKEPSPDETPQK
jgi:AsmA-like C-terminal region